MTDRLTAGDFGLPACLWTPTDFWLENEASPETLRQRSVINPLGRVPYMLAALFCGLGLLSSAVPDQDYMLTSKIPCWTCFLEAQIILTPESFVLKLVQSQPLRSSDTKMHPMRLSKHIFLKILQQSNNLKYISENVLAYLVWLVLPVLLPVKFCSCKRLTSLCRNIGGLPVITSRLHRVRMNSTRVTSAF